MFALTRDILWIEVTAIIERSSRRHSGKLSATGLVNTEQGMSLLIALVKAISISQVRLVVGKPGFDSLAEFKTLKVGIHSFLLDV